MPSSLFKKIFSCMKCNSLYSGLVTPSSGWWSPIQISIGLSVFRFNANEYKQLTIRNICSPIWWAIMKVINYYLPLHKDNPKFCLGQNKLWSQKVLYYMPASRIKGFISWYSFKDWLLLWDWNFMRNNSIWAQCHKTFCGRNLRVLVIIKCAWTYSQTLG